MGPVAELVAGERFVAELRALQGYLTVDDPGGNVFLRVVIVPVKQWRWMRKESNRRW